MAHDPFENVEDTENDSGNRPFSEVLAANLSRRRVLQGGVGAAALLMFGAGFARLSSDSRDPSSRLLGFAGVPVSENDLITVPEGYTARAILPWGDPVQPFGPRFRLDAGNSADEQAQQIGMHHDGMHFFPLPEGSTSSDHGLLVMNHEYINPILLHTDGRDSWSAAKARKELHAHGVSITEIRRNAAGEWETQPSLYGRRVHGNTPIRISGPAAGHALLKTQADPGGREVLGTLNNCAMGVTPWGTYIAAEENFHGYFVRRDSEHRLYNKYGVPLGSNERYPWHKVVDRFDLDKEPNEVNRFGWFVEIDPFDPQHQPVKRTAMGRFSHEGAAFTLAADGRVVAYCGDDSRGQYIYKYVSKAPYRPLTDPAHNRRVYRDSSLLDEGTLYVARFNEDGSGEWLPLVHGERGLTAANGFASQAEVLVNTRGAADIVGATPMDRPEWGAVDPTNGDVYFTLTNNHGRGSRWPTDAANPRPDNTFGHIVRWREAQADASATDFEWDLFVLCGDPEADAPEHRGNINGDIFACPDGLWMDPRGVLWVQTDISNRALNAGPLKPFGNNAMVAADPATGEVRRFLTGPRGCEITGVIMTPDLRTMFINVQHPGETSAGFPELREITPELPAPVNSWPAARDPRVRPRSATVVITKDDGGIIGS